METEFDSPTQAAEDSVQFFTSDIGNDLSDIMFKIIDCQHKQDLSIFPKGKNPVASGLVSVVAINLVK